MIKYYSPFMKYLVLVILPIFCITAFCIAAGITFALRISRNLKTTQPQGEVELPEVIIPTEEDLPEAEPPSSTPSAKLKVMSATLVGLWENEGYSEKAESKLAGVRILGEVKNVGGQVASEPTPVFRLFDEGNQFLASKKGTWTVPDSFHPLPIGEEILYDTYLSVEPESFHSIEISFNTQSVLTNPNPRIENLKIKDRAIAQKEASSFAKPNRPLQYLQFSGTLVNLGKIPVTDLAVSVWVKDSENKILAAEYVKYSQDILTTEQEIPILMNLLPFRDGDMKDHKVAIYGKTLE